MKSVNDRVYLDYIEIEYKQHSVSKATVEHLESDIKTLIDSQGIKLTKIFQIQLATIVKSAEKNSESKIHLFKIREKLLRENTRLCFIVERAKSLHLDKQDEYLTKVYSYIFSKNTDNDFIKNIKNDITGSWLREEPWFREEPSLREIKRVFYTVSNKNKTVEDLLDKMGENSNLPNSLKKALLSIPEGISVEKVKKIFDNVTAMCQVFSNLLNKGKYFSEIHSFNVLLVRYIRTQDEIYLKDAKDGFRDLEESIENAAEEENNAKHLLRQKEELLKKKLKEEPELKMDLEKLTQKYYSLSNVIETSDQEIYKKYFEDKNIAEAGKFLETIESRLQKQKLLAQEFKSLEGFLKPEEETTVNVGSYNSPHLENFKKIVDELHDRRREWKVNSPDKFRGLKAQYINLFASEEAALEFEFNKFLKTNNPKEMDNFFKKVLKKIEDEKARRTAHSKAIYLEIETLTKLESKINSVDFTPILVELSTVKKQADDLLKIPGFEEDKELKQLVAEISIREGEVKESPKKATAIQITFGREEPLESLLNHKEQLTTLLEKVENEKESHIKFLDSKKNVLKENTGRVLSSLKTQFLKKKDLEDKLNDCKEKLNAQRKEALTIRIQLTQPGSYTPKSKENISISKVDKIDKEAEEIKEEIDKTLTEIAENKEESLKSMSDKITVIEQQPEKIKRYEGIIRNNENELHKISGPYLKTQCVETISKELKTLFDETDERAKKYAAQVVCWGTKNTRKKNAVNEVFEKTKSLRENLDTNFNFKNDFCEIERELCNLLNEFNNFEAVTKTSDFDFFGTGKPTPHDEHYIEIAKSVFKTSLEELEKFKRGTGAAPSGK